MSLKKTYLKVVHCVIGRRICRIYEFESWVASEGLVDGGLTRRRESMQEMITSITQHIMSLR